jgi:hypothetical protein
VFRGIAKGLPIRLLDAKRTLAAAGFEVGTKPSPPPSMSYIDAHRSNDNSSRNTMARLVRRIDRRRPSTRTRSGSNGLGQPRQLTPLAALAALLLLDAEDDDEELSALLVAHMAFEEEKESRMYRYKRYGKRGPYNARKSEDFLELLLYQVSSRWFKAWLR